MPLSIPAYTGLTDGELSQDQPVTQPKAFALRDDPKSMLGGGVNAEYNQSVWHPYDGNTVGDGNDGSIYSGGAQANVDSPDWEDGFDYAFYFDEVVPDLVTDLGVEIEGASSGLNGFFTLLSNVSPTNGMTGYMYFLKPRATERRFFGQFFGSTGVASATISPVTIMDFQATAQKRLSARFRWPSPRAFASGNIYMYRRRDLTV